MPDPKWGGLLAFVELAAGAEVSISDLIDWCRDRLASYKVPRNFVFEPIVKTSTGKVQKFELRARAKTNHVELAFIVRKVFVIAVV